jgi:RNA polymerase sigma-70 factor (ECF subfamily)
LTSKQREELLCTKCDRIKGYLGVHGIAKEDRDDLLHEVLIRALGSLEKLKDTDKIDGWLWAITRNVIKEHFGRRKKERERSILLREEIINALLDRMEADVYRTISAQIDRLASREKLTKAVSKLDQKTVFIFRLYYCIGYPLKEIAELAHWNYSTVKSLHARGLKKLKDILEK